MYERQEQENIGMLYIDSGLINTKPVIGEERILVFRILLNTCFYKVGCRKLFPVEYGVRGVHFQKFQKEGNGPTM